MHEHVHRVSAYENAHRHGEQPQACKPPGIIGGTPPPSVTNDMGIRDILSPESSICNSQFLPQVEVRNYGTNDVISFKIEILVNDVVRESVTNSTTLSPLETTTVIFQPVTGTSSATENVSFRITETNFGVDNNPENDQMSVQVQIPNLADFPFDEDFESYNGNGWLTSNNNGREPLWDLAIAPNQAANNQALFLDWTGSENESLVISITSSALFLISAKFSLHSSFQLRLCERQW